MRFHLYKNSQMNSSKNEVLQFYYPLTNLHVSKQKEKYLYNISVILFFIILGMVAKENCHKFIFIIIIKSDKAYKAMLTNTVSFLFFSIWKNNVRLTNSFYFVTFWEDALIILYFVNIQPSTFFIGYVIILYFFNKKIQNNATEHLLNTFNIHTCYQVKFKHFWYINHASSQLVNSFFQKMFKKL